MYIWDTSAEIISVNLSTNNNFTVFTNVYSNIVINVIYNWSSTSFVHIMHMEHTANEVHGNLESDNCYSKIFA